MQNSFFIQEKRIKNEKIEGYSKKRWEGEGWFEEEPKASLKRLVDKKRLNSFFIFLSFCFLILLFRSFWLQIIRGDHYRSLAEGNRIRIQIIKASRGLIYDRSGNLLVKNIPRFDLYFIPADLPRDEQKLNEVIEKVAQILVYDSNSKERNNSLIKNWKDKLHSLVKKSSSYSYQPQIIQEDLSYEKILLLETEIKQLPGIILEINFRREYLGGEEISHLLGYLGKITQSELEEKKGYLFNDFIGRTGLEAEYEEILRGEDGKKQIEVDSLGKEKKIIKSWPSKPGLDLVLSLDLDLQKELSQALKNGLKRAKSRKGAAVILDPYNGQILAMVSLPDFDNNKFSKGISENEYKKLIEDRDKPLFHRAISGEYPSGSTIKPLIASAALEEGIITPQTIINSTGGIKIKEWFFPDWKTGGHGLVNVIEALAQSVNTFFYYLGGGYEDFQGLGIERIEKYLRSFGLGQLLGIDLPNEKSGFLANPDWKEKEKREKWYIGDTYHLAIGQGGILVTPLQVASWAATIANGGILYRPQIVKEIQERGSEEIKESRFKMIKNEIGTKKVIRSDFIKKQNLEVVKRGMRKAVISGTARALAELPIKVAGKTGTAQVGGDKKPHAWFTCFAPYDHPRVIVTILIENAENGTASVLSVAKEVFFYLEPYLK